MCSVQCSSAAVQQCTVHNIFPLVSRALYQIKTWSPATEPHCLMTMTSTILSFAKNNCLLNNSCSWKSFQKWRKKMEKDVKWKLKIYTYVQKSTTSSTLGARNATTAYCDAIRLMPCLMKAKRKLGVMDGWELNCPVFLNLAAENVIVSVTVLGPGPVTTCNIVTTSRPTPVQSVTTVSH